MEQTEQNIDNFVQNLQEIKVTFFELLESINNLGNRLDVLQLAVQKSFPTTFQKNTSIFGGGIRGGVKRGFKGGIKGGAKGGGENADALKDFTELEIAFMQKMLDFFISSQNLTEAQKMYLNSREQKIISLKALRKLNNLKYTEENIKQAIYNAIKDSFWSEKFKHLKALANTSKNGCLVIDNLLNINKNQTKISSPRTIVF